MIILKLMGGLGNQMFQYALYLNLKAAGKEVYFDLSFYDSAENKKKLITDVFLLELPRAKESDIIKIRDSSMKIVDRIRRKLFGSKGKVCIDSEEEFQREIFEMDNVFLSGYWQSEKYFKNVELQVREKFNFIDNMTEYQKDILKAVKSKNSVAVHIRRGDYLELSEIFGNICTEEYYQKAIKYFEQMEKVHFFIFSNDIKYVKQTYHGSDITIVESYSDFPYCNMDMYLMSQCRHKIIANSSYSWWGAWLNNNHDKKVIAPNKWLNTKSMKDIYCDDWIKI